MNHKSWFCHTLRLLTEHRPPNHLLLVHSEKQKLVDTIADFLKTGIEHGQLCIYAYVDLDVELLNELHEKIDDFDFHVSNNNLILVELKPYKEDIILNGDYGKFDSLKDYLVHKASARKDRYIRFVGDLESDFFYQGMYEYCKTVERWCQHKPFNGCCVCPYDSAKIKHNHQKKEMIFSLHDDVVFC